MPALQKKIKAPHKSPLRGGIKLIVDVHTHFYPEPYLKELLGGGYKTEISKGRDGTIRISYPGDYNIVAKGHVDLEYRLKEMAKQGVRMQVISLTTPGVHLEDRRKSVKLAKIVNDSFSEAASKKRDHVKAFATLPMSNPEESVEEVRRAANELGLSGFMLFSNINGKPIDSPQFFPVLEEIARSGKPLLIHPTSPSDAIGLMDYRLTALIGFPFETTVAAARLIFSGIMDRLENLKVILAHLGGAVPYIAERLDRGYKAYKECAGIKSKPSKYLKNFYLDTVSFYPPALKLALEFSGSKRLLFGTDYPHQIGDISLALQTIKNLRLDDRATEQILGGNAADCLGLD